MTTADEEVKKSASRLHQSNGSLHVHTIFTDLDVYKLCRYTYGQKVNGKIQATIFPTSKWRRCTGHVEIANKHVTTHTL